jgi:hypothetical protein
MSGWDLALFIVTLLGLFLTVVLAVESFQDVKYAPPRLRPLGMTIFRHELVRAVKQLMLVAAIAVVAWRDVLGVDTVITIRNALIAGVAIALSLNSLWDVRFRSKHLRCLKQELSDDSD